MSSTKTTLITAVLPEDGKQVVSLLANEGLPTADLPEGLPHFLVATDGPAVIGAVGLEVYGNDGLLRSMAVSPAYRSLGIAARLLEALEAEARQNGVTSLYLLTETAADYFQRKGFVVISRDETPDAIQSSSEFSSVCPVSATLMRKNLSAT
ncbi:GNAT family N-acetyltransferase [Flavisolibacter sp. BT320]|nr:GNAT family N-acetyltransferase [Flavisolibacter longurius]